MSTSAKGGSSSPSSMAHQSPKAPLFLNVHRRSTGYKIWRQSRFPLASRSEIAIHLKELA